VSKRQIKLGLFYALIPVGVAVLIYVFTEGSRVYYYTISEALEQHPKSQIRIAGYVVPGSISRKSFLVHFKIRDETSPEEIQVDYRGIPAETFKDNIQVVVKGRLNWEEKTLHASDLLVKCPSKYEAPIPGQPEEKSSSTPSPLSSS